MSSVQGWSRKKILDLIVHHASGPSPTCEERNIASQVEWGLLKTTAVKWSGWNPTAHKVPPKEFWENKNIEVRAGDVLITKAGPRDRCGVTAYVTDTPPRLMVSGKMILLRPDVSKVNAVILACSLASEKSQRYIDSRTTGMADAQLNFTNELLLRTLIDVPPLDEQRKIAKIFSTVDNLIEKTQALIDKYQSIKQGMMHDLFTRGIDENGQLRPSYEEAPHLYKESELGWIPKGWEVKSLGTVSDKIQDGTHFSPQTTDGECLYVTSKNIRFGYMDLSNCGRISKYEHEQIYRRCDVKKGDILLTKDGANTGNAAINTVSEEFSLLSSVAIVRASDKVSDANYIVQYLLSPVGQNRLKDLMSGNAITRLTLTKIKAFIVEFAPYKEQVCIGKMLLSFDLKVSREKECLEKYKTIKAGLMQDLLTGKVRVTI
ncbi:type I restriction enzyme, S subunit [Desulfuromusa kysingii]|uniref:Type I restriction enzyme, S subunit n=1 Tax=Desulfuromusa kysingii TaxID=37625 RepID=A0A1H3YYA7_9BACT|nr:restriction endonuclease subunit S [Desulfuromusa kysingii]SEA16485.1 type I restriction enzyme, S subunit [Desulfuromusa kysingii]